MTGRGQEDGCVTDSPVIGDPSADENELIGLQIYGEQCHRRPGLNDETVRGR